MSIEWSRYRFATRPKWIVSHVFVFLLVASMLGAMVWQIQRLHFKEARNRRIEARTSLPAVPVQQISSGNGDYAATRLIEFHKVTATGRYLADQQVLVRGRTNTDDQQGAWVITPLDLGHGEAVAVNRGFIPDNGGLNAVPKRYAPPKGIVTVRGLVRQTETRGSFGSRDPKTGTITNFARADIARLDQQVPEHLLPMYFQLLSQTPKLVRFKDPEPVPFPTLDNGPHFSYAVQWAIFSTIAAFGYPLILRRRAREIERGEEEDDFDPDGQRLRGEAGPDGPGGPRGPGGPLVPDGSERDAEPDPDGPDPNDEPAADDPRLDATAP